MCARGYIASIMQTLLDHDIVPPLAWTGSDLPENAGLVALDPACQDELMELAALLAANPLPVLSLRPDDFELPACRALMARVAALLDQGPGFAIIDGFPLARLEAGITGGPSGGAKLGRQDAL